MEILKMQVEKNQKQKQIFPTGNTVNPYNKNVMHKMQQVKVQFVLAVWLFSFTVAQKLLICQYIL